MRKSGERMKLKGRGERFVDKKRQREGATRDLKTGRGHGVIAVKETCLIHRN